MKAKALPGGQKKMAGVLRKAEMNIAAMTFRLQASWIRSLKEEISRFVEENCEAEILEKTREIRQWLRNDGRPDREGA